MQMLYEGQHHSRPDNQRQPNNGQSTTKIMLLTAPNEIASLLEQLGRIAAELLWQPADQIHAHADQAVHIAALEGDKTAGGLQVIVNNEVSSLPCLNVWPEVSMGMQPAARITILALEREYRGHPGLFWPLCVELWRWCQAAGIRTLFLEATPATMRVYQRMGWPLEVAGELRLHWGEDCYLCRTDIRQMEKEITRRASKSTRYQAFLEQAHRK